MRKAMLRLMVKHLHRSFRVAIQQISQLLHEEAMRQTSLLSKPVKQIQPGQANTLTRAVEDIAKLLRAHAKKKPSLRKKRRKNM